ncbi:Glycos_transf_1 domain-containing protein, partial [Psidium guajava]
GYEQSGFIQPSLMQSTNHVYTSSTLSGVSTPVDALMSQGLHSSRHPRRDTRTSIGGFEWFQSQRLLYWVLVIVLWSCLRLYAQPRWAHGGKKDDVMGSVDKPSHYENGPNIKSFLAAKQERTAYRQRADGRSPYILWKRNARSVRHSRRRLDRKRKATVGMRSHKSEEMVLTKNASYGMIVGPFSVIEDKLLGSIWKKQSGTCNSKGDFGRAVRSRKFVLIIHELSMTGAPLSMMELATELLSCQATVSVVVLSKKGGLMRELTQRRIRVLEDRAELSFKAALQADLVIAGSAVCASWIEQYTDRYPTSSSRIVWWIMENRREYFDRSRMVLDRAEVLVFLSKSQSRQWLAWCKEENIKLRSAPAIVPLSVNDELAFVAGIACSLNTPSFTVERMMERRQKLRSFVRKEMGLTDEDMLVITLSSINPGKGQLLLLESAHLVMESHSSQESIRLRGGHVNLVTRHPSRSFGLPNEQFIPSDPTSQTQRKNLRLSSLSTALTDKIAVHFESVRRIRRKVQSENKRMTSNALKILIGSVGSKSNKRPYLEEMLRFLSLHSNFSKSVLWTPATTHIAPLYTAADAYAMNSQGLGETFGRVTLEAMAFGLPVLGTDAGGTKEIVEHNETGLLHPPGKRGAKALALNLRFLLKNPSVREQMGMRGRRKVERMYLKQHMYLKLTEVLFRCLRTK